MYILTTFPVHNIFLPTKSCHLKLWRLVYFSLFFNPNSFCLLLNPVPLSRPWYYYFPHLRRSAVLNYLAFISRTIPFLFNPLFLGNIFLLFRYLLKNPIIFVTQISCFLSVSIYPESVSHFTPNFKTLSSRSLQCLLRSFCAYFLGCSCYKSVPEFHIR